MIMFPSTIVHSGDSGQTVWRVRAGQERQRVTKAGDLGEAPFALVVLNMAPCTEYKGTRDIFRPP